MPSIDRTNASGLIPEDFFRDVFAAATEASAVMSLARRLPDGTSQSQRLAVLSALPMTYWVDGEPTNATTSGGRKTPTQAAWQNRYIEYREIAAIVPIPQAVLDDAQYPIWDEIRPLLIEAIGHRIDAAVLFGTNAPSVFPPSILAGATAAGNAVALGTGADLYDDLLSADGVFAAVEADGYMVTGVVAHPEMMARLRGLRDQTGQPLFHRNQPAGRDVQSAPVYDIAGVPVTFLRNGAFDTTQSLAFAGAWDQLVHSVRRDATFDVLREAVIQDPTSGDILYNLAQQNMVALRVSMRWGWQIPNPTNRLNPNNTTRYPFAVLTPA